MAKRTRKETAPELVVPPMHDWRTSDADEINRRRQRARSESFAISNIEARFPIFSNFRVRSGSGLTYTVEVRDVGQRQFACTCVDFRINGLGTCKHVEAVLNQLQARFRRLFESAAREASPRIDVVPDPSADKLRVLSRGRPLPPAVRGFFDSNGLLKSPAVEEAVGELEKQRASGLPQLRLSQEIEPWLAARRQAEERKALRHQYELRVQSGEWPQHETRVPLFPYQREGMLHLAFTERALLADEMGLGKTIQAIAACALLHRLGQAQRVLVVTPASLKTEWEEQIQRFTHLPLQLVFGGRLSRLAAYRNNPPFFTITNYEQMMKDALDVNEILRPDVIVLDEAQRIKNWSTKTTQAIKRLRSRYAFILTGTPIENRIDELYSLMDFLNPSLLGPLFRFNREYYVLDKRGRPSAYQNLDRLHARIKPLMLRRRKLEVETELPERTDRNHFVPLSPIQQEAYADHEATVARLATIARRRPLSQQEQEKLMRELAMMRMVCDTNYILDPEDDTCPKLAELEKILEECRDNDAKVIVFSEWERMLQLVRRLCEKLGHGFAWHTGSVPQRRRRAEINAFKADPECRVFLSTDSGSTGLNLQNASVVINCDLPWNPAKLEQRIARAWRKHQTRPVTIVNLVAENTIEHRMLGTLADKAALSEGVLDLKGDLKDLKLRSGKQAFLAKLEQIMVRPTPVTTPPAPRPEPLPADRALAFSQRARHLMGEALMRCEERYPKEGAHSVLLAVVADNAPQWREDLARLHEDLFGEGRNDPLAPVRLEVIDRSAFELLERLAAAGLITTTIRATRSLYPADEAAAPPPLSAEERARATAHRQQAARKLKMSRLLCQGGLPEEGSPALLEAILATARALAIENRFPEPADLQDAVSPPLSACWSATLPVIRAFAKGESEDWATTADALEKSFQAT